MFSHSLHWLLLWELLLVSKECFLRLTLATKKSFLVLKYFFFFFLSGGKFPARVSSFSLSSRDQLQTSLVYPSSSAFKERLARYPMEDNLFCSTVHPYTITIVFISPREKEERGDYRGSWPTHSLFSQYSGSLPLLRSHALSTWITMSLHCARQILVSLSLFFPKAIKVKVHDHVRRWKMRDQTTVIRILHR